MLHRFYVDTCIYLNLWQKEGNKIYGIPYWRLAKNFFEKFDNEEITFHYSGFVLKELKFILPEDEFKMKSKLFNSLPRFKKIKLSREEFEEARKIESEEKYGIGFYDIIHMILARKSRSILITRDKKLLELSKKCNVEAKKPEDLL